MLSTDGKLHICPKLGTLEAYTVALLDDKVTISVPPWLGQFPRSVTTLRGMLAGRISRLNQMQLTSAVFHEACCVDLVKWLSAGYSVSTLKFLWAKVRTPGSHVVRKFLSAMQAASP